MTPEERFWTRLTKVDSGCWEWNRPCGNGYGYLRVDGKGQLAHRFALTHIAKRPIPDGLVVDHLCRNTRCVNPDHLEAVTQAENNRRGLMVQRYLEWCARITHCPQGHEYSPENTAVRNGKRHCRACDRDRSRRNRQRKKEAA